MASDQLVTEAEDDLDAMEAEVRKDLREFSKFIPRAVGTEKALFEDRKWDFDNREFIPDYWPRMWALAMKEALTTGGTWGEMKLSLFDHAKEMTNGNS